MLEVEIDELIDVLKIEPKKDVDEGDVYVTSRGFVYGRPNLRKLIRQTLGIDKQCSECANYFFDYELSLIEDTPFLICQKCAEGIISGQIKKKHD